MFECIWAHDLCNQRKTYGARFERHGQITSGTPSVRHWTWLNLAHPEVPQCLPFRSLLGSPGSTGARKAPSLHCWLKPKLQGINCAHHISYLQTSGNNKNYSEIFRVWYDICTTSLSDCICTTSLSDLVSGRWTCSSNLDQQNIGDGGKTRLESNMWNNGNGKQIVMPNNAKHGARGLQMAAILQAVPCCTMHQDTRDKWGSKSFTTWALSQNDVCCICSICSPRILSSALQPYSAVPHRTELWAERGRLRPGHSERWKEREVGCSPAKELGFARASTLGWSACRCNSVQVPWRVSTWHVYSMSKTQKANASKCTSEFSPFRNSGNCVETENWCSHSSGRPDWWPAGPALEDLAVPAMRPSTLSFPIFP